MNLWRNSKQIVRCQLFLYVFHRSTTAKFDQSMVPATTLSVALLLILAHPVTATADTATVAQTDADNADSEQHRSYKATGLRSR